MHAADESESGNLLINFTALKNADGGGLPPAQAVTDVLVPGGTVH